jgi:hypothetical protein
MAVRVPEEGSHCALIRDAYLQSVADNLRTTYPGEMEE